MNPLKKIRQQAGNYILRKSMKGISREKRLVNLHAAESVGILFELSDQTVYHGVHKFVQSLQDRKIRVKALGYAPNKAIAAQFLPVLSFDIITARNLDLFNIPRAKSVSDFTGSDFDVCINIAPEDNFSMKYIAAVSRAKLKAGSYYHILPGESKNDPADIYDLLIREEDERDPLKTLENIRQYLTILKPAHHA